MNNPLVSIITPCYNAERTIADTIESVLSQTYENWEMLVVDDCSTDSSPIIIHRYADSDKRVLYFKTDKPSGSPAKPRNIGLDKAKGELVAFLDSDDLWLPEKLMLQITYMLSDNSAITYSYYEKITWDGKRENRLVKTRHKSSYNSLLRSNSIPCLTSMIRKEAIGDTRFKEIPQEDFCFWLDLLKKGHTAKNICQNTALYRESNKSRSANKFDMFKGFWNVIRGQQKLPLATACLCMVTFSVLGVLKYLK